MSLRVGTKQTTKFVDTNSRRMRPLTARAVCREDVERSIVTKSFNLLFSVATAAALTTSLPVDAKQILTQPKLKSIYYEDTTAKKKSENSATKSVSSGDAGGEFGLDLGFLSLPLTVIGCGALYVAGQRVGGDFEDFISAAMLKDSAVNGIGYEEEYKSTDYSKGVGRR
eukprot:g6440.t1